MRAAAVAALAFLPACESAGLVGSNVPADASSTTDAGSAGSDTSADGVTDEVLLDVGNTGAFFCTELDPPPCDDESDAWHHAMGIGCDGDVSFETSERVHAGAVHIHEGALGTSGIYTPREGNKMVVLSTGYARELLLTQAELEMLYPGCDEVPFCPSRVQGGFFPELPIPLDVRPADPAGATCIEDPSLVGRGDCSNTLWEQWISGEGATDYAELRVRVTVPETADAFSYDFAFFTTEYPEFVGPGNPPIFNDMYIAWLESNRWTGNVSFDRDGNPISVRAVFTDYKESPELEGFAMERHAGTIWLTTTASVEPGEEIELVFALFDVTDTEFDSFAILDNFRWTCSEDSPPVTVEG